MNKHKTTRTRPRRPQPEDLSSRQSLLAFKRLLGQTQLKLAIARSELSCYDRIFSPVVTLWCMVFQRLNHDHTLQAAVTNLHLGGADRLSSRNRAPLSQRIKSMATTAFSNARRRLPLSLLPEVLAAQARDVWKKTGPGLWLGLRVMLMDGSQISLRPYPEITTRFDASANQNGKAYWALMRVVATFCAHTGIVVASTAGPDRVSEQTLACQQISTGLAGCLYLGDRNFGIFRVVQCVLKANAHCLFRLTQHRASRLAGSASRLPRRGDFPIQWYPSKDDIRHPECCPQALDGRLIVAQYKRPGFRTQWIYLFTTLTDTQTYSAQQLLDLYAIRWHIELNLRYLKSQMNLTQIDCKSADMAEKEWMAGLMAYNLIRALMLSAALRTGVHPNQLSFSATRRLLVQWLLGATTWHRLAVSWNALLSRVAQNKQPRRPKPRPPEPRAKRHKRQTFPPLRGSRARARSKIRALALKS
jgi:hypothetical protein